MTQYTAIEGAKPNEWIVTKTTDGNMAREWRVFCRADDSSEGAAIALAKEIEAGPAGDPA